MSLPDPERPEGRRGRAGLDPEELAHLLTRVQDGVVSRQQLRELGARDHDIVRLVRRRDLVAVHPGVYVGHTGKLTWVQRAWVAVLACWPAALSHQSALPNAASAGLIHVAIEHRRSVRPPAQVVVHRMADFDLAHQLAAVAAPSEARARRDRRGSRQDLCDRQVPGFRGRLSDQGDHGTGHCRRAKHPPAGTRPLSSGRALGRPRHRRLLGTGARVPHGWNDSMDCRRRVASEPINLPAAPSAATRRTSTSASRSSSTGGPSTTPRRLVTATPSATSTPWFRTTRPPFGSPTVRSSTAAATPSRRLQCCWSAGAGPDRSSGAPTALDA